MPTWVRSPRHQDRVRSKRGNPYKSKGLSSSNISWGGNRMEDFHQQGVWQIEQIQQPIIRRRFLGCGFPSFAAASSSISLALALLCAMVPTKRLLRLDRLVSAAAESHGDSTRCLFRYLFLWFFRIFFSKFRRRADHLTTTNLTDDVNLDRNESCCNDNII